MIKLAVTLSLRMFTKMSRLPVAVECRHTFLLFTSLALQLCCQQIHSAHPNNLHTAWLKEPFQICCKRWMKTACNRINDEYRFTCNCNLSEMITSCTARQFDSYLLQSSDRYITTSKRTVELRDTNAMDRGNNTSNRVHVNSRQFGTWIVSAATSVGSELNKHTTFSHGPHIWVEKK